jgi:hypothetical protein
MLVVVMVMLVYIAIRQFMSLGSEPHLLDVRLCSVGCGHVNVDCYHSTLKLSLFWFNYLQVVITLVLVFYIVM